MAFETINTALSGLQAHQRALDVTGHNVANAATPGYHRQEAVMEALCPRSTVGSGVSVAYVRRLQDAFLAQQMRQTEGQAGRWSAAHGALQQIESVLAPGAGLDLSSLLDGFYGAWGKLASHPEDAAAREVVLGAATTLTDGLHRAVQGLNAVSEQLTVQIGDDVAQVNTLADQLAMLNEQIAVARVTGNQPNDLLDQRDLALEQITTLTGATSVISADGAMVVTLGGRSLIESGMAHHLAVTSDATSTQVVWEGDRATAGVRAGEIAGRLEVHNAVIPAYTDELDAVALGLASSVNNLHGQGYNLDGDKADGYTFFTGSTAAEIQVSPTIAADARKIAATRTAGALGDGGLAGEIAGLARTPLVGKATLHEALGSLTGQVGTAVRTADTNSQASAAVRAQMMERQQAASGVSIDEEMTNMLVYQRAYDACARVLTVADEMLRTLIDSIR